MKTYLKDYNSFIYIWFNSITRMFYVGKHFGHPDDGYICSSIWMQREYKKNPQNFKRRIIEYVMDSTGNEILQTELKWMSYIKNEELGKKYYNLKNKNFGNTRGHKKSYMWNKGMSQKEIEEYRLLRKNKLFCLLTEKPTKGMIYIPALSYICDWCKKGFVSKRTNRKFCDNNCAANYRGSLSKGKPSKNKGLTAWNKGIPNPTSAENGRRTATKQSETVTGRKIAIREDGSRYWIYPNN